jgi:molybdopterin converting factor small subunit
MTHTPNVSSLTATPHHPITLAVELFGVPRLLAGERTVLAAGETLGELAADLAKRHPVLAGRVLDPQSGWPLDGYSFVVAERFTRDPSHPLREGTSVLLVASAAGG